MIVQLIVTLNDIRTLTVCQENVRLCQNHTAMLYADNEALFKLSLTVSSVPM